MEDFGYILRKYKPPFHAEWRFSLRSLGSRANGVSNCRCFLKDSSSCSHLAWRHRHGRHGLACKSSMPHDILKKMCYGFIWLYLFNKLSWLTLSTVNFYTPTTVSSYLFRILHGHKAWHLEKANELSRSSELSTKKGQQIREKKGKDLPEATYFREAGK